MRPGLLTATGGLPGVAIGSSESTLGSVGRSTLPVEITAALASDLTDLSRALDEPGTDIAATLRRLAVDAKAAVPSYSGLTVVAAGPASPVAFTAAEESVDPDDVRSSLVVPLSNGGCTRVRLILYAARPGAFVDLAADLAWLTGLPADDFGLDHDLPMPAEADLPRSLGNASVVNQAIGVLVGRGHTLEQATADLDARAAGAGHSRADAARVILSRLPTRIPLTEDQPHPRPRQG